MSEWTTHRDRWIHFDKSWVRESQILAVTLGRDVNGKHTTTLTMATGQPYTMNGDHQQKIMDLISSDS